MAVMYREVEWLRNRLPIEYRKDVHLQKYRRSAEHCNMGTVEVEGPPPMRKDCVMCMRDSVEALTQELLRRHAL